MRPTTDAVPNAMARIPLLFFIAAVFVAGCLAHAGRRPAACDENAWLLRSEALEWFSKNPSLREPGAVVESPPRPPLTRCERPPHD